MAKMFRGSCQKAMKSSGKKIFRSQIGLILLNALLTPLIKLVGTFRKAFVNSPNSLERYRDHQKNALPIT